MLFILPAVIALATVLAPAIVAEPAESPKLHFTVSMDRPSMHYFHVVLWCERLPAASAEFKMPSWTPGYYRIMDYAANVVNFQAADGPGRPLAWEKTAKNAWRVNTGGSAIVVVSYDVYGFTRFVASNYLADDCAFVCPTATFMYVAGWLNGQKSSQKKPIINALAWAGHILLGWTKWPLKNSGESDPKLLIENSRRAKSLDLTRNGHDSECTRRVAWFGGPPPTRAFDVTHLLD